MQREESNSQVSRLASLLGASMGQNKDKRGQKLWFPRVSCGVRNGSLREMQKYPRCLVWTM